MKMSTLVFDMSSSKNILDLVKLAETADERGFSRFWLGEHYSDHLFWSNPEPLIPVLLGLTNTISVGTAGTLLRLHSVLRVACTFKLMSAMYPERVDLGLAAGVTSQIKYFTGTNNGGLQGGNDFFERVEQVAEFLDTSGEGTLPSAPINPPLKTSPDLWLLSTSFSRFPEALRSRLNYCRSIFHGPPEANPLNDSTKSFLREKDHISKFKDDFHQAHGKLPKLSIAFSGIITNTDSESRLVRDNESRALLPFSGMRLNIVATPKEFASRIQELVECYGVDDLTFLDFSPSMERRVENVMFLSEHFNLAPS